MKYPKFLTDGGTIGFIAPSFGCTIEPYKSGFEAAIKKFREMGYNIYLGENCYRDDGIGISSSPENCGRELTEVYCGSEADIIISCGGGELMCEILPHTDFERMKKALPKWYLGYSDNTNFTFLANTILDTAAVYGPCAPTFGMPGWHKALTDAWDILTGKTLSVSGYDMWERESLKTPENPLVPYNLTEEKRPVIKQGSEDKANVSFSGRLLGGCLDTLLTLEGTEFDKVSEFIKKYKNDGIIWFLEACDLSVLQIRRGIWQLKHAGWFEGVSGFIFGRPYHFDEPELGMDRHLAQSAHLEEYGVPIVMDVDIGHLPPSVPIISGALAEVEADQENWRISYTLG